jgi:hypothetical protein
MWQTEKWLSILFRSSVSNFGKRRISNHQSNVRFLKKTFELLTGKSVDDYNDALMKLLENTIITSMDLIKKNGYEPEMYEFLSGMEWTPQTCYSIPTGFDIVINPENDEPLRIMNHVASDNFWVFSYQEKKFENGYFVTEDVCWSHTAYYWHYKFHNRVFPYLYIFEVPKGTPFAIEYASLAKHGEIGAHFTPSPLSSSSPSLHLPLPHSNPLPSSSTLTHPPPATVHPVFDWNHVIEKVTPNGPINGEVRILSEDDDKDKLDVLEKIARFLVNTDIDTSNDNKKLESLVTREEFEHIKSKFSQVDENTTYLEFTRGYLASFIFEGNKVPAWSFYDSNRYAAPNVFQSRDVATVFNDDLADAINPFLIIECAVDPETDLKKWVWIRKYAIVVTDQVSTDRDSEIWLGPESSARHGNNDSIIVESEKVPGLEIAPPSDPRKFLATENIGYEMEDNHHFTIILPPIKCKVIKTIPFETDDLTKHKFSGIKNVIFAKIQEHKVKSWTKENAQVSYNYYMKKLSLQSEQKTTEEIMNMLTNPEDYDKFGKKFEERIARMQQELDELLKTNLVDI